MQGVSRARAGRSKSLNTVGVLLRCAVILLAAIILFVSPSALAQDFDGPGVIDESLEDIGTVPEPVEPEPEPTPTPEPTAEPEPPTVAPPVVAPTLEPTAIAPEVPG